MRFQTAEKAKLVYMNNIFTWVDKRMQCRFDLLIYQGMIFIKTNMIQASKNNMNPLLILKVKSDSAPLTGWTCLCNTCQITQTRTRKIILPHVLVCL